MSARWVYGRHVVEESLGSSKCRVLELLVLHERRRESEPLARQAKRLGARVRWVKRSELDRLAAGGSHQGFAARIAEAAGAGFQQFLAGLSEAQKARTVVVALDQIQDPHNFGAIARSAACLGASALVVPERRSAPVSQAALSASAGAIQKIPVLQVVNLAQALERLKEAGFWIYGADGSGRPCWDVKLNVPMVLVVGSEGEGIRPLVRSCCDEVVAIPQSPGGVESLNASCAASVLLYEAARQNGLKGK